MSQQPEQNKTAEEIFKDAYIHWSNVNNPQNIKDAMIEAMESYASQQTASLQKQVENLEYAFDDYIKSLCKTVGITEEEINLPSAYGNNRLRWAALYQLKLQKQVEELRKCNDQILMKSIGQHERIAQLEEALKELYSFTPDLHSSKTNWEGDFHKAILKAKKALNPQDNQKEK